MLLASVLLHLGDNPDDLAHRLFGKIRRRYLNVFAQRTLIGPELPCHGLVDDSYRCCADGVLRAEFATLHHPDLKRAEVIRHHWEELRSVLFLKGPIVYTYRHV